MSPDPSSTLDDLLDRLVAEYSDRVHAGRGEQTADLLARVDQAHRPALERCFRMIRAGLAATSGAPQPIGPGTELDGYRIVREIGRGGMAVVYEAEQADLERRVALKVLRPGLAFEPKHVDRFKREALAVARLQHPHIVQIFGVGECLGHHYIAMELVHGKTLSDAFAGLPATEEAWTASDLARATGIMDLALGSMTYEQALAKLLAPVVRAVGLAHELGMVHRDIKPSNILIHADGRAVIADFGLAKNDGDPALSLTGEPLGTPYYMSPEQAAVIQDPVDHRSDVYSFGVTLYEGLVGQRPFEGDSFYEVLESIRRGFPPSPRAVERQVTRHFDAVVRKAMARRPEDRYTGAIELSTELDAIASGRLTRAGAESGGFSNRVMGLFQNSGICHHGTLQREYKSAATFLGLPLIHVHHGPRMPGEPVRVAKGWFAVGEVAVGGIACAPVAFGGLAFGGVAMGVFVWAGIALGGVTFGGVSVGLMAIGGLAIGLAALGGQAIGVLAHGGNPIGRHTFESGDEFFQAVWNALTQWF